MINEDAPTNSVGTGAETALPPSHEPPGITRLTRAKVKKRRYEKSVSDMLKTEDSGPTPVIFLSVCSMKTLQTSSFTASRSTSQD